MEHEGEEVPAGARATEPTASTGSACRGGQKGEALAEEPVARQAETRPGHPEGVRSTTPAALLPSSGVCHRRRSSLLLPRTPQSSNTEAEAALAAGAATTASF